MGEMSGKEKEKESDAKDEKFGELTKEMKKMYKLMDALTSEKKGARVEKGRAPWAKRSGGRPWSLSRNH